MTRTIKTLLRQVVDLESEIDRMPALPANEEAKLENNIAIDHLYFSSALEGSMLNGAQISLITHEGFPSAE